MYQAYNITVPVEKRAQYNKTIVNLIASNDLQSVTPEEIYNGFTGKGGLHGLKLEDFNNYYEYSNAKKVREHGQFFTPPALCTQILEALQPPHNSNVADITCGSGNFFNAIPEHCKTYGNELDSDSFTVCKFLYPNTIVTKGDFVHYTPSVQFDMVVGNPPFNLQTKLGVSQHAYMMKACELLKYAGVLAVIVPKSYLADHFQDKHKISWIDEHFNFLFQCHLPSNAFNAVIDTKLLVLQKKGVTNNNIPYNAGCFTDFNPTVLYSQFMAPLYQQVKKDAPKLHLLAVQKANVSHDVEYQMRKKLWHIKSNPKLKAEYYDKALQRVNKLHNQVRPDNLSDAEWNKVKLTPERVLNYFNRILRDQNDPEPQKVVRVVKYNYGLKNKAYHKSLDSKAWKSSVHDLLFNDNIPAPFNKLYARKRKAYDLQNTRIADMQRCAEVDKFLDDFVLAPATPKGQLFAPQNKPTIRLNQMQKNDLGLSFQKPYFFVSWEQGGGKSVAGMTYLRFWENKVKTRFVIAPSLAISGTWEDCLTLYGFDYIRLETIQDVFKIKAGQIVIATMEIIDKLQRFIKKFVKKCSYKIGLIVDESDELSNPNSNRTKAILNCFRKGKRKVLLTGTSTHNTINELYPQFELLYNNSSNFLCEVPTFYSVTPEGTIKKEPNDKQGYPFPAYSGYHLFKSAFCPHKTTVFGISQDTQDVYNVDDLSRLIGKTIITRSFEQIVGEKKHSIHTHTIQQKPAERELYELLLKDFLKVVYDYYTSTGNSRKESGLRLIRQIMALIKASSVPHLMKNYEGDTTIGKYEEITSLIEKWADEIVTIGTTLKGAARDYYKKLSDAFPDRKLFYIDGEMTPTRRKKVLKELKESVNGILICTQASLKSSINIPFCNRVIIESLQWNIPKMSQFFFRFIRFDNTRKTEVHFVCYENTIEINLLGLLMAKEKLNQFVKNRELIASTELYDNYDMDINLLDSMITKRYDSEGHLTLSWGNQSFTSAA